MARFIPEGSYQKTSQNISVTLYCEAQRLDQSWIASGYPISQYLSEPNAGLVNWDGYLAPEQGSYPPQGFIPEGSYKQTCRNIRITLGAKCQKADKSWHYSALDITDYDDKHSDIANMDGVLKINPKYKIIESTFVGDGGYDNIMKSIQQYGKQPFKYMDYLYVAFADLDNSIPDSPKIYFEPDWKPRVKAIIAEAKKENPSLIIFAQFNWASHLAPLVEYPAKANARIDAFAKSIPPFLTQYGFSGLDFDWESVPEKLETTKASYLFTQVKTYIGSGAYLSISADNKESLDASVINEYVDIVNVQSYERLSYIDDFIAFGINKSKIHVGICSENDIRYYPPSGDISKYTKCVIDKNLPGLYAWRIDNDDTDHSLNVPRYTITKAMWKFSRGNVPPLL